MSGIGDKGRVAEKHELWNLGAEPTVASGATDRQRGDGEDESFVYEVKSTVHKSMSVKLADLVEAWRDAIFVGKYPAVVLSFTDAAGIPLQGGSWVCIERNRFKELCDGERAGKETGS